MADIRMIAYLDDLSVPPPSSPHPTVFLPRAELLTREPWMRAYTRIFHLSFHSHGKHTHLFSKADYVAVVLGEAEQLLGSAFVITEYEEWKVHYVMTDPAYQRRGLGMALMERVMYEAKQRGCRWVDLNCDPQRGDGYLPRLYGRFGFQELRRDCSTSAFSPAI